MLPNQRQNTSPWACHWLHCTDWLYLILIMRSPQVSHGGKPSGAVLEEAVGPEPWGFRPQSSSLRPCTTCSPTPVTGLSWAKTTRDMARLSSPVSQATMRRRFRRWRRHRIVTCFWNSVYVNCKFIHDSLNGWSGALGAILKLNTTTDCCSTVS